MHGMQAAAADDRPNYERPPVVVASDTPLVEAPDEARQAMEEGVLRSAEPVPSVVERVLARQLAAAYAAEVGAPIPGGPAADDALLLRAERWPPEVAMLFLRQVAALLDRAEEVGLVLVPFSSRCIALDGVHLAIGVDDEPALAHPAFCAPEQYDPSLSIDGRASQYGLATLAMLILDPARGVAGPTEPVRAAHGPVALSRTSTPGTPHPGLPPAVARVLLAGRDPRPERRFSLASDFLLALEAAAGTWSDLVPAVPSARDASPPASQPGRPGAGGSRRLVVLGGLIGVAMATVAGAGAGWVAASRPAASADSASILVRGSDEGRIGDSASEAAGPRTLAPSRSGARGTQAGRPVAPALGTAARPRERVSAAPADAPTSRDPESDVAADPADERKPATSSLPASSALSAASRRLQALADAVVVPEDDRTRELARRLADPDSFAAEGLGASQRGAPTAGPAGARGATASSGDVRPATATGPYALVYPHQMLARRVAGEVVARFVVDTAGRVDPGSFRLVSATNPAFVHPVRTSVPRMRYAPAESAGRRIPQVVEQAFRFTPPD